MPQPISAAPGQPYGERKQQEQAQAAVPMASAAPMPDPFGPSMRPQEPATAGVDFGPGPGSPPRLDGNKRMLTAEVAKKFPHAEILDLLNRSMR